MKTALVVIDMQEQFKETARPVLPKVRRAIRHAKAEGWPIVHLFYGGIRMSEDGIPPIHGLRAALLNPSVIQVEKEDDGGGDELCDALYRHSVEVDRVVFAGVNATACVASTVAGFARNRPDVECIVSEAVNSAPWHRYGPSDESKPWNVIAAERTFCDNVVAKKLFE